MKAVLLCAGYGTRLYPLTKDTPKPLLPVGGKPILDYLFERVRRLDEVNEVFIVTNDRFHLHFERWAEQIHGRPRIEVVNDGTRSEEARLGAVGDLAFVLKKYGIQEEVGVFAGDNLFQFDLQRFIDSARSHRPHASLGVVDVEKKELAKHYGIVCVDKKGRIREFFEKPADPPSTLASTGVYWMAKEGLDFLDRYIREGHNADRIGDYFAWLVKVDAVYAHPFKGSWFDVGDLNSYRRADELFHRKSSSPTT